MAVLAQTWQEISRRTARRERGCAKTSPGLCCRGTAGAVCCWRRLRSASVSVLYGKEAVSSFVRLAAFGVDGQRVSLMTSGAAVGQSVR